MGDKKNLESDVGGVSHPDCGTSGDQWHRQAMGDKKNLESDAESHASADGSSHDCSTVLQFTETLATMVGSEWWVQHAAL